MMLPSAGLTPPGARFIGARFGLIKAPTIKLPDPGTEPHPHVAHQSHDHRKPYLRQAKVGRTRFITAIYVSVTLFLRHP